MLPLLVKTRDLCEVLLSPGVLALSLEAGLLEAAVMLSIVDVLSGLLAVFPFSEEDERLGLQDFALL